MNWPLIYRQYSNVYAIMLLIVSENFHVKYSSKLSENNLIMIKGNWLLMVTGSLRRCYIADRINTAITGRQRK